ncbi:OmpP1/FadL family transporter [Tahibacter harae]|uniref:Outer membrane protein transport protein n=1 Tax=Tahibacter harae TaxID=2963937 RepID=A0ABT1QN38_9GAMM|nr:outer membrane protein transport protein [Tahibacter harae]MCQ4163857.1 outer membrane protein transport protein [Tahibacter harae]
MKNHNVKKSRSFVVRGLAAGVVGALAAGQAPQAAASAFQLKENSVRALGRAFAGSAAAPGDAAVVVNNPAAMSLVDRAIFQADVTGVQFSTEFSGAGTDAAGRPLTGGDGGNGGVTKPIPALYYIAPLGDQWRLGFAVSAPFGFETDYDHGWAGRYSAYKSMFQSVDLTLAASYQVSDTFSVGASVAAQHTKAELTQAIDFGAVLAGAGAPVLPQSQDGYGRIEGDDWGWGWGLGLLWKPTEADSIGLNFHSQVTHTLSGTGSFQVPAAVTAINPALGNAVFVGTPGRAGFTTPAYASASWWHVANERVSFGADVGYTRWSTFKNLVVDYANPLQPNTVEAFNWEDTWFGSLGMEYRFDPAWVLRAGVAVDGSPTQVQTRTPRVPDGTRRWVTVGLGYAPSDSTTIDFGYGHIFVNDAQVDTRTATGDRLRGEFESSGNLLGVSAQFRF